jgi:YidC/Oxa1 family membrane protein insertase
VWWVTLLALVVIVRLLLFPVAQKAIKMNEQMLADQAKLKPNIDAIKEKYKDSNVQYQKTMALYKKHGINPMAPMLGCVPVLLQLPVLIAIFNLLGQEVKMQGATFLWVNDLSIPDQLFALPFTLPYFGSYFNLLPLLMSVTMVLTTNLGTSAVGDQKKSQMRSMTILAFFFFALFYSFPAGLVIYWMMSNIGQYLQQQVMARRTS